MSFDIGENADVEMVVCRAVILMDRRNCTVSLDR